MGRNGMTPLQAAATKGCPSAVCTLLALSADVNVKDCNGRSVLALAAVHGHTSVITSMLEPPRSPLQIWEEDQLTEMLQCLPWVADAAADKGDWETLSQSSGASVCSSVRSSIGSHTHGRSSKRQPRKRTSMKTITEVDSVAESVSRSPSPHEKFPENGEDEGKQVSDQSLGQIPSDASVQAD